MKMMYGGVPIKSLKVKHYGISTDDCTMTEADMQAGVTGVARGRKIVGTGKAFSFASYGTWTTNEPDFIFTDINTVQISSIDYPVRMLISINDSHSYDFSTPQEVAEVVIDGISYPMTVCVQNGEFVVDCEKRINIELFIGKDEYI